MGDNERRMDPFDLFLPRGPFGRALQEGMAFLLGGFRNSLPSVAEQNAANRCQLKARVAVFLRQRSFSLSGHGVPSGSEIRIATLMIGGLANQTDVAQDGR